MTFGSVIASADTYVPRASRTQIEAPSEDGVGTPLHSMYNGFRVGAIAITGGVSEAMKERGMEWPMTTVIGVETVQRIRASQKLHFIVVGNLLAGGFDQNFFFVNANGAVGLDINETVQLGMGVNLTPGSKVASAMRSTLRATHTHWIRVCSCQSPSLQFRIKKVTTASV